MDGVDASPGGALRAGAARRALATGSRWQRGPAGISPAALCLSASPLPRSTLDPRLCSPGAGSLLCRLVDTRGQPWALSLEEADGDGGHSELSASRMASDPAPPWTFLLAPAQQPLGALKPSLSPPSSLCPGSCHPPGWAVSTSVCQPMAGCRLPGMTRCPPGHFSPKGDPVRIQQSPPAQHLVTTNLSVSVDLLLRMSHRGLLHDAAFGVWPLTQHPVLKAHRVLIRTIFRCVDRPHMMEILISLQLGLLHRREAGVRR